MTAEDLGIDLEEDSENFTQEEADKAEETLTQDEFVSKAGIFLRGYPGKQPHYELRRRAGILYCRVLVEGADASCVYQLPWLRTP